MNSNLRNNQETSERIAPFRNVLCSLSIVCFLAIVFVSHGFAADTFDQSIRPLLRDYCVTCHSTERQEGEFDLERFDGLDHVKDDADAWERVQEQLELGEMPPKEAKQLSEDQRSQLVQWVQTTLDEIALANAGDPGPVVLRRLSNHEYTYTLRDLTGVHTLDPGREFPVDGAAGEGFTNVGSALVMSPALLSKYMDAAKEVSQHAVLLPDGIRFSPSTSPRDWTDEALARLRGFYSQHTSRVSGDQVQLQGIDLDMGTGEGRLPLAKYLMTLQGHAMEEGLSRKYLEILRASMESSEPSVVLDPLRAKFRKRTLTAADIEMWQNVLWKFSLVGHIGRPSGPKAWQEPVNPFSQQQEFRVKLEGTEDHQIHLVARTAGDGSDGDRVRWENPRLVAKDRPEIPVSSLPELQDYLKKRRAIILESVQQCLAMLAQEQSMLAEESNASQVVSDGSSVDVDLLRIWREYLGLRETQEVLLEPLLSTKLERVPDYDFVQGWTASEDLSILANSSDSTVRIPGTMEGHSIMVHPSPSRASVVAWRSPISGMLRISGRVLDAHLDCGDGIAWEIQVRRGRHTLKLASGITEGGKESPLGPFEDVRIQSGQVVALVVRPQSNHSCDATTLDLTLSDGTTTWDLAKDVSSNILQGNPHGPWHFLSEAAQGPQVTVLPAPMASWCEEPSAERALLVRDFLRDNFPLTHPLLQSDLLKFQPSQPIEPLTMKAPGTLELNIPADLADGAEFVVTGKLDVGSSGSVQLQVLSTKPDDWLEALIPEAPVIVPDNSVAREHLQKSFDDFRSLFPIALCYSRIVPVDEVVTLRLYYREDEHLQRLILDEQQVKELDRIWSELLFVSQAPLKQVDAFEQIYQFATQDRADLVVEFEKMREPIERAAEDFQRQQQAAGIAQREAVIDLTARAWRRPLTEQEKLQLQNMPPRLGLVRMLTSPAFLYRSETPGVQTGPINDWELATRLSYFLWSSLPDDELIQLAAVAKLSDPNVLAAQASRMLKDDRVRRLATEFGCQYLHVRDVASLNEKSERHFPTFKPLREAMQEEVARFYIDLFQNDRSVLSLLDADHTFLNKPLAEHYGIPFDGTDWQRVEGIQQYGRGGALGFSATLAKHSGASRTSAILRGTWVSEVLLGDKIPNPPKGVPTLPEEAPQGLNERQLIERHSSDARCAGCHKRIDPFGFALEGFDAMGRSRSADTQTVVFDGTSIDGLAGLREYLVNKRRDDFLRQFSRKLLGYALGRSSQLSDQPLLDRLTTTEGSRIGKMIELIVRSPQFREIRGRP